MLEIAKDWLDYELIDSGDKNKLERWGNVVLIRPDPQAIWHPTNSNRWHNFDAIYHRSNKGGGSWEFKKRLDDYWTINYKDLVFKVSPTNFKHTGLFPEQAVNWDWLTNLIKNSHKGVKVLNLFAYTGAATMACAKAGAQEVVHVDAAKGMINWAKENMVLNNLQDSTIRFIVDDCLKFVQREQRRNHKYDIIIMDPPSYGRGPNNELWKLEDQLEVLIEETAKLLNDDCLGFLINTYTTGFSHIVLENLLNENLLDMFPQGHLETIELALPMSEREIVLPCGISGRFTR